MMKITNKAVGARGVHTVTGVVYLDPGQTIEAEVSDAEAPGILAHPDLVVSIEDVVAPQERPVVASPKRPAVKHRHLRG